MGDNRKIKKQTIKKQIREKNKNKTTEWFNEDCRL